MTQLDLFPQTSATAEILSFPPERRATFAHSIAVQLTLLDIENGRTYWKAQTRAVKDKLRKKGLSSDQIRSHVDQLADVVHDEMKAIQLRMQYRSPALIVSMKGEPIDRSQYAHGGGAAVALGQGTKFLAGFGAEPHAEYDAARAYDGGAA